MDRTEELEARLAWYEKQLAELDGVVRELFAEVARLSREVEAMREAMPEVGGPDEKPPHY